MIPIYVVLKSNGELWAYLDKTSAAAVSSPLFRAELTPSFHPGGVKIGAVTGNSGSYGFTDAKTADLGNTHARSF